MARIIISILLIIGLSNCSTIKENICVDYTDTIRITKVEKEYLPGEIEFKIDKERVESFEDSIYSLNYIIDSLSGDTNIMKVPVTIPIYIPPVEAETEYAWAAARVENSVLLLELEQKDTLITRKYDSLKTIITNKESEIITVKSKINSGKWKNRGIGAVVGIILTLILIIIFNRR